MPLVVNIRHLAKHNLRLQGQLPVSELDIDGRDAMIQLRQPLKHDLEVERLEDAILAQGHLRLTLDCLCVRCLKPVRYDLDLADWTCLLPLSGEEKVAVVNDCVDLTPHVREDILLAFPQHPLCKPGCGGLLPKTSKAQPVSDKSQDKDASSPWTKLDKLKF
jgi:uncharacterized protein